MVHSYEMPFLHVRWIFLVREAPKETSLLKTLQSVGCYGVFVAASSAYVALDTYSNCSHGVRRFSGPGDKAFEDRSLANLTSLRLVNENSVETVKDFRNTRLEPQTTIAESIIRRSHATVSTTGYFKKFGRINENFLFTGAVGAVQMKQKDLGTFEIYLTEAIWYGLGLAGAARYDSLTFLSPLPMAITDLTIIGRPFSRALWAAVWASLGVYLLLLVTIMTTHSTKAVDILDESTDLFFYLSSALVNHAPDVPLSRHSSARILVAFWFMFAVIISAGFVGVLTSYTNFPPKARPITTLEQLSHALERNDVKLCIRNNRYFRDILYVHLLKHSRVLKEHFEENLRESSCQTTTCCLEKVAKGTHVFVTNREEARFHAGKAFKGVVKAEEDFFLVHVVLIAPKASPYTAAFSHLSRRLIETGVSPLALKLTRVQNAIRTKFQEPTTCHRHHGCYHALHLKDLYGLLVVWAFGLTLGLFTLLCEFGWKAFRGTRLRKKCEKATIKHQRGKKKRRPLCEVVDPHKYTAIAMFGFPDPGCSRRVIVRRQRRVFVSLGKTRPEVFTSGKAH
ncbi:hypothetical protein V5799_008049 [Amblyomma americanum]|uniref:Ionotropic glutamate receptor C-terminal domain-containing protein n=1 Tax=Amblyomma americanum TaxID=6943 RepID=A0AAQ4FG84_AMBAM